MIYQKAYCVNIMLFDYISLVCLFIKLRIIKGSAVKYGMYIWSNDIGMYIHRAD